MLVVNYRLIPKHSVGMALDDCHDAYRWLRLRGYEPDQIVLAGDSAGGYLALALAQRLQQAARGAGGAGRDLAAAAAGQGTQAGAPEYQDRRDVPRQGIRRACSTLVARLPRKHIVDGKPEQIYEPLDHIEPGLPRTLIHVSGSEVLLHDARLAARRLAAAGVPAEVRVWPGQIHDFQLAGADGARGDPVAAPDRGVHPRGHRLALDSPGSLRAAACARPNGLRRCSACGSRGTSVTSSATPHWFS